MYDPDHGMGDGFFLTGGIGDGKPTIRARRCRHFSICARCRRKHQHRASTRTTPPAVPRVQVVEAGAPGVAEAARCGDVAAAEDAGVDGGALGAAKVALAHAGAEVGACSVVADALDLVAAGPCDNILYGRDAVVPGRAG
jgi:hypothetical protein